MDQLSRDRRYILENRYESDNWKALGPEETFDLGFDANKRAEELSKNSICYGMVRVVDMEQKQITAIFSDGHPVPQGCG